MKAILLSIRPEWVAKILNGEKTIEVRKQFPKDYVGWVYIYCTKTSLRKPALTNFVGDILNGKVVARFWCDKVEEITVYTNTIYETPTLNTTELLNKSCLHWTDLQKYLGTNYDGSNDGYAIHISKLEVFDKPKEIYHNYYRFAYKPLTKAPQNYCYIEIGE